MSEIVDSVPLTLREAASGAFGSVSLACWIFLLVPQLIENYKYGSADALSLTFLLVWFVGDVTNLIGALWAKLVPVVVAIGIYFCIADGVLISQCVYYNVKNARKLRAYEETTNPDGERGRESDGDGTDEIPPDPTTPLLSRRMSENLGLSSSRRRSSAASLRRMSSRLSNRADDPLTKILEETEPRNAWIKNTFSVLSICAAGVVGWAIAWQTGVWKPTSTVNENAGEIAVGAQVLGYFSAVCYLGARIPQIIKNHRDQSCEGLSLLFFLFSLLGNASYGAGILFHSTEKEYFLTNLPWLIGSLGTMVEDVVIFAQFRIYAMSESALASAVV